MMPRPRNGQTSKVTSLVSAREFALNYVKENEPRFLAELEALVRIRSISFGPWHRSEVAAAARWLAARLQAAGLDRVEVIPTQRHPLVYAEALGAGPSAPTVLICGHYDVQDPRPLEDWETPPFEPTIKGENLFGRGATDMKGQLMASIAAVEALIQSGSEPVNVKFLLDGGAEIGSPGTSEFLAEHCEQLACDCVLVPDAGGMPDPETPVINYALRGIAVFTLRVFGPRWDLHAGAFGGAIDNPIHVLSRLIAGLHDEAGRITLPDFYNQVRLLDPDESRELAGLGLGEDFLRRQTGVPGLGGEADFAPLERIVVRPSVDVLVFEGGQPKAAIPARASAQLLFSLVADQEPDEVYGQFRRYLEEHTPASVRWELEYHGGSRATLIDRRSPGVRAMHQALEYAFGRPPIFLRCGGSTRVVQALKELLGADSVLTAFAQWDDQIHGPNEKINLTAWTKGMVALTHFFCNLPEALQESV
jgi:acetylornithine deacetylase/succinyl-diaminopimelate desuccinylase-like protein